MSPGRGTGSRLEGFYGPRPFCAQKRENKGKNGIKQNKTGNGGKKMEQNVVLEMRDISKNFTGVRAFPMWILHFEKVRSMH